MKENNLTQNNEDMLDINEEMLDQITGGTVKVYTEAGSKNYTIQKGDNLSSIAAKKCGAAKDWQKIYQKNKKVIGNNPNQICPGTKLEL